MKISQKAVGADREKIAEAAILGALGVEGLYSYHLFEHFGDVYTDARCSLPLRNRSFEFFPYDLESWQDKVDD